ncbi:LuxR C-terminal-related transcriptional regulator [Pseudonocardia hispaniensis]|uniref:LuxR C-terminal-related transcriptional regulator n=1 Tax=Pseudonocardia hispaniensis TaxID=904933 RepID=A0ABW1J1Z3_9PSEU
MDRAAGSRPLGTGPTTSTELIEAGRAALARGAWEQARARFEQAAQESGTGAALEGLSWAAWWLNDATLLFDARERAYHAYSSAGDRRGAARLAAWIGTDHVDFRGEHAVAQGWLGRARRLLEDLEPGAEHGWLLVHEAEKRLFAGNDTIRARELGLQAAELGRRLGLVDLEMVGLATDGLARVTECRVDEGMALLDQAAVAAFGGEFHETWSSIWCGCYMLYACERARDYERSAQWCRRILDWSARRRIPFLDGVCRAHYAGVLIWLGAWAEAERMLNDATTLLTVIRPPMRIDAMVNLGELRRRQGRLDEAAEIFDEVAVHPLALLGLGEIHLDRDDPAGARDRAEQYLRETGLGPGTLRAAGLELLIRAHVALREPARAEPALRELESIADAVATAPLRASARFAAGLLAAATDAPERARTDFEDASRLFHRCGAPYEAARARIELGRVLAGQSRARDAMRELRSAATSLRRIGAVRDAELAEAFALDLSSARRASPLTTREREVLRLVAEGRTDRAIADELVLSEHTVHRHVANILTKLGCPSRSAAVAEALRKGLI